MGAAKKVFRRPRRGLGARPRDSSQEGWGRRRLVWQEGTTAGVLSASEASSPGPQTLKKVDNTLVQSQQEEWGRECKTLASPGDSEC